MDWVHFFEAVNKILVQFSTKFSTRRFNIFFVVKLIKKHFFRSLESSLTYADELEKGKESALIKIIPRSHYFFKSFPDC